MSPRKKDEDQDVGSGVGMDALSEEAQESLTEAVRRERAEDAPNRDLGAGAPGEADFVTPKQDQGGPKR